MKRLHGNICSWKQNIFQWYNGNKSNSSSICSYGGDGGGGCCIDSGGDGTSSTSTSGSGSGSGNRSISSSSSSPAIITQFNNYNMIFKSSAGGTIRENMWFITLVAAVAISVV